MRHVLAAIVLTASIPAWADQPVAFAAEFDRFVVISTATGSVRKDGPFLAVSLARHTLRQTKEYKTRATVIQYRLGLVRNNADGRWETERWSDSIPVGFTLNPGDTRQLPPTTALVPIDNFGPLKDAWLVVEVKVQREGKVGTTYSHSNKLTLD